MEMVPGNYYNMHPGNHLGQGSETGISLIAQCLNAVLDPALSTTLLLETMAGKGTEVGRTFGELRAIIDRWIIRKKWGSAWTPAMCGMAAMTSDPT